MKDEEMADKQAEEYVMREDVITENDRVPFDNGYGFQTVDFEEEVKKGYKDGFLDGLKAGRPQWHKVADGDLPKDEKDMLMSDHLILLTRIKGTDNLSISIGQFNFSTQEFDYQHIVGLTDVIAWCEIPIFDKE